MSYRLQDLCDRGLHQFAFGAKVVHNMGASLFTHEYDIECLICGEMITQKFLNLSEIPEEVINDFYARMKQRLNDKYPPLEASQ